MGMVVFALGAILVSVAGLQLGLVTYSSIRSLAHDRQQRQLSLELLYHRIKAARASRLQREQAALHWNGYRKFVVNRKVREAEDVCSFYLTPHDGKPLPHFRPGQYLTFRLKVPGRDQPVIRCYSLSDAPRPDCYRVTIKRVAPPVDQPDLPPGLVSSYFHESVRVGSILDVQAPSGQFVLDPFERRPAVLIAGGVGLTPMMCMVNTIAESKSDRPVWLFYGVRNGSQHPMKKDLRRLARKHENIRIVHCYSHPIEDDVEGRDYDHGRQITVELLKEYLGTNNYQFYICGPPGMMQAMTAGLKGWGVPQEDILTEAFGPATVSKAFGLPQVKPAAKGKQASATAACIKVRFDRSGKVCDWDAAAGTLLEFALASGVSVEHGCRAGNCSSCLVALKSGNVSYLTAHGAQVEQGACLLCISVPEGDITLDA